MKFIVYYYTYMYNECRMVISLSFRIAVHNYLNIKSIETFTMYMTGLCLSIHYIKVS